MAVYAAKDIAHYVVDKCTREQEPVSNLQLQKILYFLQVAYYKETEMLLFDEEFEAWPYGPVIRDVYREYFVHGGMAIEKRYEGLENLFPLPVQRFVDEGITSLRRKYPWDLVKIAHADGSPWSTVWKNGDGFKKTIPNRLLATNPSRR